MKTEECGALGKGRFPGLSASEKCDGALTISVAADEGGDLEF